MGTECIRKLVGVIAIGMMSFVLASCGLQAESGSAAAGGASPNAGSSEQASALGSGSASASTVGLEALSQTGWTEAVPAEYRQASAQAGSVERIEYDSLDPLFDGYVLVLNGSGISGLAFEKCDELDAAGFDSTADNADDFDHETTRVYYSGSATGAARAKGVVQTLGLDVRPEKNNGKYDDDYNVIVVLGKDAGPAEDTEGSTGSQN